MKHTLLFQLSAFVIYLLNHIGHFYFKVQTMAQGLKIAFAAFLFLMVAVFLWDYQYNFKKRSNFNISAFLYLSYGIASWLVDGFYYFVALNLILLIAFYLFKRKHRIEQEMEHQ